MDSSSRRFCLPNTAGTAAGHRDPVGFPLVWLVVIGKAPARGDRSAAEPNRPGAAPSKPDTGQPLLLALLVLQPKEARRGTRTGRGRRAGAWAFRVACRKTKEGSA